MTTATAAHPLQMPDVTAPMLEWALYYYHLWPGLIPLPTAVGAKHPLVKWKQYQTQRPPEYVIRQWWRQWPNANIGFPTGRFGGFFVLDADVKNGGDESLREMFGATTPETPTVRTGGGGSHLWLAYTPIRNSAGALDDYPGLDIRGDGGFVVAPPSMHASGRRYTWEESYGPSDVPLAPMPPELQAALDNRGGGTERTPREAGDYKPGMGRDALLAFARGTYLAGTHHATLQRFAGVVRMRGLPLEQALAAACTWANTHLSPHRTDEDIERAILSNYQTYATPPDRVAAAMSFTNWLLAEAELPPPPPVENVDPDTGEITTAPAPWKRETPIALRRTLDWYEDQGLGSTDGAGNRRMSPIDSHGGHSSISAQRAPVIFVTDRARALRKEQLLSLLEGVGEKAAKICHNVEHCHHPTHDYCATHPSEHGVLGTSARTCKAAFDASCGTDTTVKLKNAYLPDMIGGASYRFVRQYVPVDLVEGVDAQGHDREGQIGAAIDRVVDWFKHARTRKAWDGRMVGLGETWWLDERTSTIALGYVVVERVPGDMDGPIAEVEAAFAAILDWDSTTPSGDVAVRQLMELSSHSLAGMTDPDDQELFTDFFFATYRRKMFQRYGLATLAIKAAPVAEEPKCPVCAGKVVATCDHDGVPLPRSDAGGGWRKQKPPSRSAPKRDNPGNGPPKRKQRDHA